MDKSRILYEDNHILVFNKACGELVQGDSTGDACLLDTLRGYIKSRDEKPGNVFLEAVHRIDRPVSGIVLFAKTSKGLSRFTNLFREHAVTRTYWAICEGAPEALEGRLEGYLLRNAEQNKSYVVNGKKLGSKPAALTYRTVGQSDRYFLLTVALETGRHHQIRALLSHAGATIRGDLKYGAKRSLPGGGISLHARALSFVHPIKGERITIVAPPPADPIWYLFPED